MKEFHSVLRRWLGQNVAEAARTEPVTADVFLTLTDFI
jgi:hypothetical protein